MALIRIDWNPGERKIRQFGLMLAGFSILLAAGWIWKGHAHRAWAIGPAGSVLGLLTAALPGSLGRVVYKAWMSIAFIIGSVVSPVLLAILYFAMVTPMALIMRLLGRDALRLKRPETSSYWMPIKMPENKTDFERLF